MHFYVVGLTVSQSLYRNTHTFTVTHTYILPMNSVADDKLVYSHHKHFQGSCVSSYKGKLLKKILVLLGLTHSLAYRLVLTSPSKT